MLHVLGPQRPDPNAPACLDELGGEGAVVVITAGWRSDETDDEALKRHLGPDVMVLPLYTWFDVISRELPDLRRAYRPRQDALMQLRRLHRVRLHSAIRVLWTLREQGLDDPLVRAEFDDAMAHVRSLDEQLLSGADSVVEAHHDELRPWKEHPLVASLRAKAEAAVRDARVVVLAGGHVAVLLNRLRFFDVDDAIVKRHAAGGDIVAWSAGAMALTDRIALYYDDPPEGPGFPELLDRGLGLVPGAVLLPHARQRLRLDREDRVALFAQRFAPDACLGLENGAWLARRGDEWLNRGDPSAAFRLGVDGLCTDLECL